jgi:hypothetical protein
MFLVQIGRCGNPNLTKTRDGRRPVAFGDVRLSLQELKELGLKDPSYTTRLDAS